MKNENFLSIFTLQALKKNKILFLRILWTIFHIRFSVLGEEKKINIAWEELWEKSEVVFTFLYINTAPNEPKVINEFGEHSDLN